MIEQYRQQEGSAREVLEAVQDQQHVPLAEMVTHQSVGPCPSRSRSRSAVAMAEATSWCHGKPLAGRGPPVRRATRGHHGPLLPVEPEGVEQLDKGLLVRCAVNPPLEVSTRLAEWLGRVERSSRPKIGSAQISMLAVKRG